MSTALFLPPYLRGKNGTLIGVTPMAATIAAPGSTTNGVSLAPVGNGFNLHTLGTFDTFEFNGTYNGFELHPTDGFVENYVGTVDGFEIKLGELDRNNATSILRAMWGGYNYYRIEIDVADDSGNNPAIFAAIVTRAGGSITYGLVEEKNATILTLKPCGVLPYYGTGTPPF